MIYLGKVPVGISVNTLPVNIADGWKTMSIVVDTDSNGADGLLSLIQNKIPPCKFAIGIVKRDYTNPPEVNDSLISFVWVGTSTGSRYCRYRGGSYGTVAYFISSYDCVMRAGDNIIITYQETV